MGRQDDFRYLRSEGILSDDGKELLSLQLVSCPDDGGKSDLYLKSFLDEGISVGGGRYLGYSSMRNSQYGYWNKKQIILNYQNLDTYINSIVDTVRRGELYSSSEFYSPVRLKPRGKYLMKNLRENGVNHIELRMFDLNPLDKNGMSKSDMELIEYFLLYLATKPDFEFTEQWQRISYQNHIASAAYDPTSVEIVLPERTETLQQAALRLIDEITILSGGMRCRRHGKHCRLPGSAWKIRSFSL